VRNGCIRTRKIVFVHRVEGALECMQCIQWAQRPRQNRPRRTRSDLDPRRGRRALPWADVATDVFEALSADRAKTLALPMGNGSHYLPSRLIFTLALIRDRPQKAALCPGQVCYLHDHFRPDPMHAR
jgi:hypothetical protein